MSHNACARGPAPDFICVEMIKCGTSWLHDELRAHPDFKAGMFQKPEKFRSCLANIRGPVRGSYRTRVAPAWPQDAPQIPFRHFFFDDIVSQIEQDEAELPDDISSNI
ncbi:MAG: hypothetical protein ACJ8IR_11140 [Alphaproteobacteria bacterium]|jgi:hypothetical protein